MTPGKDDNDVWHNSCRNRLKVSMGVQYYDTVEDSLLKFAVILSRYEGKWVFCKHRERDSYEVPGGHREPGESIAETARRELYEETAAADYTIEPICPYSVTGKNRVNEIGGESYGMLFYARITRFDGELHNEIEKITLFDRLPAKLTYPLIQPKLMEEAARRGFPGPDDP